MRKQIYLAAVAALGVMMSSCVKEKAIERFEPEPEAISFVLDGVSTRSDAGTPIQVNRYNMGSDDSGLVFSLEETVSWMGDVGAESATRGTPVFTENVQDVYGSEFSGEVYATTSGQQVADDESFYAMSDGVRWRRVFGFDPWSKADPLSFFFHMPAIIPGVSNLVHSASTTAETIAFDYETPATASAQKDIIFATTRLDRATYEAAYESKGGAPLLFRHALTGVKFALNPERNSTTDDDRTPTGSVQTFITKVQFTGLASKGHAVYKQDDSKESGETGDKQDVYSSQKSFTWTNLSDADVVFSQKYSADDIVDFDKDDAADEVGGPDSFYQSGADRNLNKADASFTFWFIPQDITADLKLQVTFYVWNGATKGEEVTLELNLGERILAQTSDYNKSWLAGQLRTFTLDPTIVDVSIDDDMDDDKKVKSNVTIVNTGNKDEFVRVAIVGNWVDPNTGEILMGSVTTNDAGERTFTPADPWTEENTTFGTFTGLGADGLWVREADGFWYCNERIAPGESPSKPLFLTYTRGTAPIEGAGLVIELVVQGVDAVNFTTYKPAWQAVDVL